MTKRDVLLACDENALPQAMTTVYSLLVNLMQPELYRITLVYFGEPDAARATLAEFTDTRAELRVVKGLDTYAHTPVCMKGLATPTFARLELSKYVPADSKRVLWLDTDVLVLDDLTELFVMQLPTVVAAVRARCFMVGTQVHHEGCNTGVLVVDVDKWITADIEAKCLQQTKVNPRNCEVILNLALGLGRMCTYISSVFNYLQSGMRCSLRAFNKATLNGRTDVRIVHYQGGRKPWKYKNMYLAELWHMYAARQVDRKKQKELLTAATVC